MSYGKDKLIRLFAQSFCAKGSGPFLGESPVPTLVDLALFPTLVFAYLVGIEDTIEAAKHPEIQAYVLKMTDALPHNTTLMPDEFMIAPP